MQKNIIIIICLCQTFLHLNATKISFDTLFPITWYEKGINALIYVWHAIDTSDIDVIMRNHEDCDAIVGRCTFAFFCLKKMYHNQHFILDEDYIYLSSLILSLEQRISLILSNNQQEDYILCLQYMVRNMKRYLHTKTYIKAP